MKTKEAIWLIEDLRDDYYEIDEYCEMVNDFDQVISLLQQGEKYNQIIQELYAEYGLSPIRKNMDKGYVSIALFKIIEDLEQKYLKEAKSDEN